MKINITESTECRSTLIIMNVSFVCYFTVIEYQCFVDNSTKIGYCSNRVNTKFKYLWIK